MDKRLGRKLSNLRERIRKLDSALVAFSGGVDSAFLMRICREELGEKAVAVTTLSENYPRGELSVARRVAKIIGVKHLVLEPGKPSMDVSAQPKAHMPRSGNVYSTLKSVAMRMKIKHVLDGSHNDDADERGRHFLAARAAGVRSPLLESDLSKAEIRLLAKELGLPNWDKPASGGRGGRDRAKARDAKHAAKRAGAKTRAGKADRLAAAEYVSSLVKGGQARLKVAGGKALILARKSAVVPLAAKLGPIKRKLKSLGYNEVLLEME